MADVRAYVFIDQAQPQFAAYVGTVTSGDLLMRGMSALYVEVAPGNEVFRLVDVALKAADVRLGAQIVEREFGVVELHSFDHLIREDPNVDSAWTPYQANLGRKLYKGGKSGTTADEETFEP